MNRLKNIRGARSIISPAAFLIVVTLLVDSVTTTSVYALQNTNPKTSFTSPVILGDKEIPKFDEKRIKELQHLLQRSLSITEIDRALVRIADEENVLKAQQASLQREINFQTIEMNKLRDKVGIILRQYDQGIKLPFWVLLLQANGMSFQEWIAWYEYLDLMVKHDMETVKRFSDAQKALAKKQDEMRQAELALQDARSNYLIQKANVTALQKALDAELSRMKDAKELMLYFRQISARWLSVGLPQFRMYLTKIAVAMENIGALIGGDTLSFEREGTVFRLDDKRFNRFLRGRNADLANLNFIFEENLLKVDGIVDEQHIFMEGDFEIINQPKNGMRWNLHRIRYMGVELPLTTVQEMQETFGFTFFPSEYGVSLTLKTIEVQDRNLKIVIEF